MKFTYTWGDQPLPGFTIKRGIGKGGFGEVYFGLSDGGKEVALKFVRTNSDIEVRGIDQCLNLKHPNLVHLYDLRKDQIGNHWLIMEYVEGESLGAILGRNPQGIAQELVVEWFQGFAAGIHYLHEHNIVHRDLKPGNIFLEKGTIKVGDFGLCKLMGSQRAGQTQSVGTVHYMAPEISTGNYNRQVDVYAAGIILYEMLAGKVPFEGETAGEILMKHLTSMPDLTKVPSPFVPILDKALCKNPARRFQTLAEMSKKLAEIQVSQNRPLPVVPVPVFAPARRLPETAPMAEPEMNRINYPEFTGSLMYAVILAGLLSLIWATAFTEGDWPSLVQLFLLTVGGSWAVLATSCWWTDRVEESGSRRIVFLGIGLALGLLMLWLDGYRLPTPWREIQGPNPLRAYEGSSSQTRHPFFGALYPDNETLPVAVCYLGYFGLMFLALRWWKLTEVRRNQRFHLQGVLAVAFWAYIFLFLLPSTGERQLGFASLVMTSIIVQAASPWEQSVAVRTKKVRLRYA